MYDRAFKLQNDQEIGILLLLLLLLTSTEAPSEGRMKNYNLGYRPNISFKF
jgi:hypothetical protein